MKRLFYALFGANMYAIGMAIYVKKENLFVAFPIGLIALLIISFQVKED